MKQEQDRVSLVQSKSENLIKYISATIGVVNTVLAFALERNIVSQPRILKMLLVIDISFLLSFVVAICAQIMRKAVFYRSGIKVIEDFSVGVEIDEIHLSIYRLKCMKNYTIQLCKINDSRAGWVGKSYIAYLIGLVILFIFAATILSGCWN